MSSEKRRAPRKKHNSVLELYDEDGHLIVGIGRLVDFSRVGACFATTKKIKVGEKVHARLRLLQEGPMDVRATVVWSRKARNTTLYGIEFETVRPIKLEVT